MVGEYITSANLRRYFAEFLGTLLLVFFGVGSVIAARRESGVIVIALTFGFTLVSLVYLLGPISGCHVNPAVTLGVLIAGRIRTLEALFYGAAQLAGSATAALMLWILVKWGNVKDQSGAFGTNGYGNEINMAGALLLETTLTFLLVFVVLTVTAQGRDTTISGVVIGITLAACNLVGVALDGASVNPARSFGPAIFEGGDALSQLWLFFVAPMFGGGLASALSRAISGFAKKQ
ncbi:aquaporin [Micromonospora sp. WMMA1363]|uniref:MIP/aquaporin family protein n=1 Tax=Micromonospora sp. WMMA1363 TaxID=3053985 RepID=UPI00259CBFE9|nr:aquaporin [Micromonospora sp. WMMA1363]MDM4723522.1 aquaporin [Micromonospora sp. WMMA1363]